MENKKFKSYVSEGSIDNNKVVLLKPTTYMNNSGESVLLLKKYFNLENKDICVIQDDKDLDFGKIKFKKDSGFGGHNGIKSIIDKKTDPYSACDKIISAKLKANVK